MNTALFRNDSIELLLNTNYKIIYFLLDIFIVYMLSLHSADNIINY